MVTDADGTAAQFVHVGDTGLAAGQLDGLRRLVVAVGARGVGDEDRGPAHGVTPWVTAATAASRVTTTSGRVLPSSGIR